MRFHIVEIEPRDLKYSNDPKSEFVKLGFTIQPPLKSIADSEFLNEAAERMLPNGSLNQFTLGDSDDTTTYGSFETNRVDTDHEVNRRKQVVRDAQLVFGAALGTAIQVVFPTEQ